MKPVFADTFFFFAILNRADPLHERAAAYSRNARMLRITTDWIITEIADGLVESPIGSDSWTFTGTFNSARPSG